MVRRFRLPFVCESIDGWVGLSAANPNILASPNIPEDQNWDACIARLQTPTDNACEHHAIEGARLGGGRR